MEVAQRLYFTESDEPQSAVSPNDDSHQFGSPIRFEARVTDIRENSRRKAGQLWQIALDRTAFYPAGGGQPSDLGHLEAVSRGGARLQVPVLGVEEDASGEVWHFVEKPLASGTHVTGYIDRERRRDHAQQHTGQHLLSAVILRDFGAATISFHLGEQTSTIDLAGLDPDTLADDFLERVEAATNEAIAANLPVRTRWVEATEAEQMLARGDLRKLPERAGPIRLVEILGIEFNACGGTHVQSTGQIGGLTLRGVERVRGAMRLAFCCGLRAVRAAGADFKILGEASRALSAAPCDLPDKVARLLAELKSAAKERKSLTEELAGMEARLVLASAGGAEGAGFMEILVVERDAAYAKLLAAKIVGGAPATVVLVAATDPVRAILVLARGMLASLDCDQVMRTAMHAIGARGGGSPELAQGSVATESLEETVAALRSLAGF